MPNRKPLTTGQVARYCGVSRMGVIRWIRQGKLKAYTTPGGHYRIREEDFQEFLRRFDIPPNPSFSLKAAPRILVVTDSTQVLGTVVKALSTMPEEYDIDVALNGASAATKLVERPPRLVILDGAAPGLAVSEPHCQLEAELQRRKLPILLLTPSTPEAAAEQPLPTAAAKRMTLQRDSLDPAVLQAAVRQLLTGGS